MVHAAIGGREEVAGVVIRAAAHEDEEVLHPVRDPEPQNVPVERNGLADILHIEGDMAELARRDARRGRDRRLGRGTGRHLRRVDEKVDLRTLEVPKAQRARDACQGIGAHLALDTLRGKPAGRV